MYVMNSSCRVPCYSEIFKSMSSDMSKNRWVWQVTNDDYQDEKGLLELEYEGHDTKKKTISKE